jgi:hypothetical protein
MKKINWTRVIYYAGITALIIGILDPLEGSIVIAAGSVLIALSTYLTHDRHRKLFLLSTILIAIGVIFMFYLSSLGGFGGNSKLSWWYGLLVVPYPIGWILAVVLLLLRLTKRKDIKPTEKQA